MSVIALFTLCCLVWNVALRHSEFFFRRWLEVSLMVGSIIFQNSPSRSFLWLEVSSLFAVFGFLSDMLFILFPFFFYRGNKSIPKECVFIYLRFSCQFNVPYCQKLSPEEKVANFRQINTHLWVETYLLNLLTVFDKHPKVLFIRLWNSKTIWLIQSGVVLDELSNLQEEN